MEMAEAWVNVELGQVLAQTNRAEGDCLFVAVSQQLDGDLSPLQLREMAVNYLSEHREDLQGELLSLGWELMESGEIPIPLEGDVLIDGVLEVLSNPFAWAGAECIAAMSLALNREIRVFQEDGPTIEFPPGDLPPLRILLRYPRAGNRRTHYESVLQWRLAPPDNQSSNERSARRDASTQTMPEETSALPDGQSLEEPLPVEPVREEPSVLSQVCNPPQRRSDVSCGSSMVLRARPGMPSSEVLRSNNFSDAEEYEQDPNDPDNERYKRCLICKHNQGKYVLLNCGAYPVCGSCISTWYINIQGAPCPHCGRAVAGWSRVFNQH